MRLAVFTVCANHHVPSAALLFGSVHRFLPDADRVLVLADRRHDAVPYPEGCRVIAAEALGIPDFTGFAFRYDIKEFTAALKPFAFRHLLEQDGYTHCLYLDPDIEVFSPLPAVRDALDAGASFILTPHILGPAERDDGPNDITVMRGGIYNLGFLGVSFTPEALKLLAWWSRWVRWHCVDDQPIGLFVDQKFMDLVPGFAPSARILRDPGLNVAYWNLAQRRFVPDDPAGPQVEGHPLGFFHYSGFDPADPGRLSSQTAWFQGGDLPDAMRDFLAGYAERLVARGHGRIPAGLYAYGRFASGVPIPAIARRMFRDDHPAWAGDPFRTFEAWAHLPAIGAVIALGSAIPSLMLQWLQARTPELAGSYITELSGADRVTRWWLEHGTQTGADRRFLEPQALAAGLRPIPLQAQCPPPNPGRADATLIAPLHEASPPGQAGRALAASLPVAAGSVEAFDLATDLRPASGRLLCFGLAPDQFADGICRPGLPDDAYKVFVPASGTLTLTEPFLTALGQADEVWAPTRFMQSRLVLATGVPVLHMPLAWRFPAAGLPGPVTPGRPYILVEADGFSGCSDLLAAVEAYRGAFGAQGDGRPRLVIRGPAQPGDDLHAAIAGQRDITVLHQVLDDTGLAALVSRAACVVSLHRGEALGLPVARAMAYGVPVVATDYGGCTDLLTPNTGFPVDARILSSGQAEADVRHAAWLLRAVFDRPEEARSRSGNARIALKISHDLTSVAAWQAARLRCLGLAL